MRKIYKSAEPAGLKAWKVGKPWRTHPPSWDDFTNPPSGLVKAQATADQCQLCCYCTGWIGDGASHIEHFKPQSDPVYEKLRYAWSNLLASCESFQKGTIDGTVVETQIHCGHAKGSWYDPALTVDPQSNLNGYFRFPLNGQIYPGKGLAGPITEAAKETIIRLNLNCPALVFRRAAALADASSDAANLTRNAWLAKYLQPPPGHGLGEFWPALKYNYDKHWHGAFQT